jgi:hypothetical protein
MLKRGKNLGHRDLIWVVPCKYSPSHSFVKNTRVAINIVLSARGLTCAGVGGIDYPTDTPAEPMHVTVLGKSYKIDVQYHVLRNITYVLLDAPIFRQQTKAEASFLLLLPVYCLANQSAQALSPSNGRPRFCYLLLSLECLHCRDNQTLSD